MDNLFNNFRDLRKQRNRSLVLGSPFDPLLKSGFSFACLQPSGKVDRRIEHSKNKVDILGFPYAV